MPYTYTVVTSSGLEIARSVSETLTGLADKAKADIPAGVSFDDLWYEIIDVYGMPISGPFDNKIRHN